MPAAAARAGTKAGRLLKERLLLGWWCSVEQQRIGWRNRGKGHQARDWGRETMGTVMRTREAMSGQGWGTGTWADRQARPSIPKTSPHASGIRQIARQVSSCSHYPTRDELKSTSHWSCTNWSVISRVKMLTNFLHAWYRAGIQPVDKCLQQRRRW